MTLRDSTSNNGKVGQQRQEGILFAAFSLRFRRTARLVLTRRQQLFMPARVHIAGAHPAHIAILFQPALSSRRWPSRWRPVSCNCTDTVSSRSWALACQLPDTKRLPAGVSPNVAIRQAGRPRLARCSRPSFSAAGLMASSWLYAPVARRAPAHPATTTRPPRAQRADQQHHHLTNQGQALLRRRCPPRPENLLHATFLK